MEIRKYSICDDVLRVKFYLNNKKIPFYWDVVSSRLQLGKHRLGTGAKPFELVNVST